MSEQFISTITDEQWAELAKLSGLPPDEVKRRYADAISQDEALGAAEGEVVLGTPETLDRCKVQPFSASIWKIVGVNGTLKLCGPESDWSLTAVLNFTAADVPVATRKYTLSRRKAEIQDKFELFAVRASYKLGMKTDGWCVYLGGSVGYWKGKWYDHRFDKTLFCFGSILGAEDAQAGAPAQA